MPEAARITDMHVCPKAEAAPHVGGPVFAGSGDVLIGWLPAARVGDPMVCFPVGPTDSIKTGAVTVLINHRSAARRSDPGAHMPGDMIVQGCPSVLIGDTPQAFVLRAAARRGTPFCEECERKRLEREAAAARAGETTDEPTPPPPPGTRSLADLEPPPGVHDPLTGLTTSRAALAKQIGGDDLDGVRKAARYALVYQFYFKHGDQPIKPAKIWSHIGGIDPAKPVEQVDVAGTTMYQRGFPGSKRSGEYFAEDPAVTPEQLGTSSVVGVDKDGQRSPVTRDRRTIEFAKKPPAPGLKSTANPIKDFWSIGASGDEPATIVDCEGGGTQVMVPRQFHAASSTTIR